MITAVLLLLGGFAIAWAGWFCGRHGSSSRTSSNYPTSRPPDDWIERSRGMHGYPYSATDTSVEASRARTGYPYKP
jgi:hypothetical protein